MADKDKRWQGTTHPLHDLQHTKQTKRMHKREEHMGAVAREKMRTHEEVELDEEKEVELHDGGPSGNIKKAKLLGPDKTKADHVVIRTHNYLGKPTDLVIHKSWIKEEIELDEATMTSSDTHKMSDHHVAAAIFHKKKGNIAGYRAHANHANDITDAILRAGRDMPVRSTRLKAKSDKIFSAHPYKSMNEETLDEMKTVTNRSHAKMLEIKIGGKTHSYKKYGWGLHHPTYGPLKDEKFNSKAEMKVAMEKHPHYNPKLSEETELDETLNIQQRQKRAAIMRRYKSKIERAREIAQKRIAGEGNIKKRAYAQARQIFRKKLAGDRGSQYEKLGPSEKMAIDKMLDSKGKAIKKLALRLVPKVKKAEYQRLQSYMKGQSMVNHGAAEGKISEEFNELFLEYFGSSAPGNSGSTGERSQNPIAADKTKPSKGKSKNAQIKILGKFGDEVKENSSIFKALEKKADKAGIDLDVLGEVYDRGLDAWNESYNVSQTQYAFARVNSFINKGKTYYTDDADLQEGILSFSQKLAEEQILDELSKKTLSSYTSKVGPSIQNMSKKITDIDSAIKVGDKANKRMAGMNLAYKKMAKEETELDENAWNQLGQKKPIGNTLPAPARGSVPKHGRKFSEGDHVIPHTGPYAGQVHRVTSSRAGSVNIVRPNTPKYDSITVRAKHEHLSPASPEQTAKYKADREAEHKRMFGEESNLDEGENTQMKGKDPCWKGYEMVGKKKKGGKEVPNCVPVKEESELDEGMKEKIKGAIRREKAKDMPFIQNRRDYAAKKAGEAYEKGDEKKGRRYMDWREKSLKKEEVDLDEGAIKDAEKALSDHDKYRADYEKKYGQMSVNDARSHEIARKKLLAKKRDAQRKFHKKFDAFGEETKLDEMGGDQHYGDTKGATSGGAKGTPITTKKMVKDSSKTLNQLFQKSMKKEEVELDEVDISKYKMRIAKPKSNTELKKTFMSVLDQVDIPAKHLNNARSVWNRTQDVEAVRKFVARVVKEEKDPDANTKARRKVQNVERDTTPETPASDATKPTDPCSDNPKQQRIKKTIMSEEGNVQPDPKKRLMGTDSLVKAYKKDTPGQSLDESFQMAFDYQGKPTLAPTAAELHMQAKGGFAHHTDVQNVIEVTEIKNKIQAMFETTILEEDKDQLALSFNELSDMVQEAYGIIAKIKESTVERDAWSEAQILKMERYIQSVNAYLDNMFEDVTAADRRGEVVAGHKKVEVDPKTGQQIVINVPSHVRKAPTGKKIIKSGSPNDGIPG